MLFTLLPGAVWAQTSFIVRLADDAPAALAEAVAAGGAAKRGAFPALFDGVAGTNPVFAQRGGAKTTPFPAYVLTVSDTTTLAARLAAWAAEPGVAYVQPNRRYTLDSTRGADDPLLDSLQHLPVIRAFEAWELTRGDPSVRVGLVDTGLYFEHPDLLGQVWINPGEDLDGNGQADPSDFNGIDDDGNGFVDDVHGYDFVDRPSSVEPGDYRERDGDPSEDDRLGGGRGHGTLVAGVIAARAGNAEGIAGIAPETRLVPLRAFGADGVGEDDDVAAAIVYAAQMGLDVLNLSFGDVYYSPLMHEAIRYAVDQGTVVVASGGNLGGDGPHYPSDYPEVIAVAWLTQDGTSIAGRGTYGSGIDLGAPGSSVFTTLMPRRDDEGVLLPDTHYGRRSGSSVAAPMVSAVVALLRAMDPALTPAAIRAALTASAQDVGAPGWDHRTGAGLLDAAAALGRALPARVAIDSPEQDGGVARPSVPILGTVLDPAFASYEVAFAPGAEDPAAVWTMIDGPLTAQRLDDTLAVWQTEALPEGLYTLRLAATLRSGRTIEDRRRVFVDRTPPVLDASILEVGLIGARHGVVADVLTDDLTEMTMAVGADTVASDRRARQHALVWVDEEGRGGRLQVRLRAVNAAGLESVLDTTLIVPETRVNDAYFTRDALAMPHGYLLPSPTDFDGDGLLELVMNRYEDGWIGDTLAFYEWDGAGFRPAHQLIANVIPRDVGDPDGDGLAELLTQVGGATLVIEQSAPGRYPAAVSFVDTTGLANPFADGAAFGARLTDLDADGRGEILVHNTRQWRLLEYDG
ncbi:MAG: S8 family serine peptidase, partial [Rhodothermales bacterium]|nr:S8 family serine peptidase [Rhodothermales bacterium]